MLSIFRHIDKLKRTTSEKSLSLPEFLSGKIAPAIGQFKKHNSVKKKNELRLSDKISHTIGVFCAKYVAYTQTVKHITSCKLKNLQNVKEKTSVQVIK